MKGVDQNGVECSHNPRIKPRPVPRGPLAPHHVRDMQALFAKAMQDQGYYPHQINQVIPVPRRTLDRRIRVSSPPPAFAEGAMN